MKIAYGVVRRQLTAVSVFYSAHFRNRKALTLTVDEAKYNQAVNQNLNEMNKARKLKELLTAIETYRIGFRKQS
jgi:hypothetical protein